MTQYQTATTEHQAGGVVSLLSPPIITGQVSSSSSSSPTSSHLDPAPKHPLHLSPPAINVPARPTSATRRRRKQGEGADVSRQSDESDNTEIKEKYDPSKPTTLDKLEGWLGLSHGESSSSAMARVQSKSALSSANTPTKHRPIISRTTKLVIVHHVSPSDTLDSLALRYNTDVRTLRRSNGLWPGDSVLVRKELYIPVEDGSAHDQEGISEANEGLDGKLKLLESQTRQTHSNGHFPGRSMSTTSASSTSVASQSHSSNANGSWREVRRVPTESLSHFPPPGTAPGTIGKGKSREDEAFGYAEGLKPGWDIDHGESGVDDLLQLAEKARSRGPSPPVGVEASKPIQRPRTPTQTSSQLSSPASSSRAIEEPWKPNRYTFGQKKTIKSGANIVESSSPAQRAITLGSEEDNRGPAMMVSASYKGWNDIPEPSLHATAKGKVAYAYKGSSKQRRYPRPGTIDLTGPGGIIEDLASGLPPNSGPASNWARPIAESLPIPGDSSRNKRNGRLNHPQANVGWAQILSDTVRGKMGLEEALERGFEDIRSLAGGVGSNNSGNGNSNSLLNNGTMRRAMLAHADLSSTTSSRPSAELARVTLAEGSSLQSVQTTTTTTPNGLEFRRSSGRSMVELEDLKRAEDDRVGLIRKDWSSTWTSPAPNASVSSNKSDGSRRARRNVDWLG